MKRHILRTSAGFEVELHLDEATGAMLCEWSPDIPNTPAQFRSVAKEYEPWRNQILEDWAKRHGKRVLLVE